MPFHRYRYVLLAKTVNMKIQGNRTNFYSGISLLLLVLCYSCNSPDSENAKPKKKKIDLNVILELTENRQLEYQDELERVNDSLTYYLELGVVPVESRPHLHERYREALNSDKSDYFRSIIKNNKIYGQHFDSIVAQRDELTETLTKLEYYVEELNIIYYVDSERKKNNQPFLGEVDRFLKQNKPANSATP